MHSPIFLIGTHRSGTTLLGKMLTAHKEIFIKNEVPVRIVFTPNASRKDIEYRINKIVEQRFGLTIQQLLETEGKTIWGLKDPQLTGHLDALKQFLPEARFIVIIRDARAVVRSYIENAWGLGTNCYSGARRWNKEVNMQLAFEREVPDHVLRLQYEELILDPKRSMEKTCEFIDIPFDESMLDYANKKSFVTKNRQSINTFKAPDPAMIEKWKSELTRHQIDVINQVCGELLIGLEYDVNDSGYRIPGWLKTYYQMHQAIIGEIQIQYRWRIGGYKQCIKRWLAGKTQVQT